MQTQAAVPTPDLQTTSPRSPNDIMAGIVSLARTLDKARADAAGKLGEYHYDCPHDKPLFAFLGTDAQTFQKHALSLTDTDFEKWIQSGFLAKKSGPEITRFNQERRAWKPDPGTDSAAYFAELRQQVAADRPEIVTWFDLLDLDEGRAVTKAQS